MSSSSSKQPRRRGNRGDKSKSPANAGAQQTPSSEPTPPSSAKTQLPKMLVQASIGSWHSDTYLTSIKLDRKSAHATTPSNSKTPTPADMVTQFRSLADQTFASDKTKYSSYISSQPSDAQWLHQTASGSKGTIGDRISSSTLLIQSQPFLNVHLLGQLVELGKKEKRVSNMVCDSLRDLFTENLLPQRKLITMRERPLKDYVGGDKQISPRLLMLWRFEELLKQYYSGYVSMLRFMLDDTLETTKRFGLHCATGLLTAAPEGEETLLNMVVNKLGDPEKKPAASAAHQLRRVLEKHPAMSGVVCREVQQLAFRPNLSPQSLYNCVIFLNQVAFKRGEEDLPKQLLKTYFKLFDVCVTADKGVRDKKGKKGKSPTQNSDATTGVKGKLLGALLSGVNRARPYAGGFEDDSHLAALYRVAHSENIAARVQALMLLCEVQGDEDRFFRALYDCLKDERLYAGKGVTAFFNLVYKAVKRDKDAGRKGVMLKRLLQASMTTGASQAAAGLFLVSAVGEGVEGLWDEGEEKEGDYDGKTREPKAQLPGKGWEAANLKFHFHPSVRTFAEKVVDSDAIDYKGDPLKDFTLAPFLDRFAFRNPKSRDRMMKEFRRGESVAEKKSGGRGLKAAGAVAVNDPKFLSQGKVGEHEEFFFRYFAERERRSAVSGVGKNATEEKKNMAIEDAEVEAAGDVDVDWEADDSEEEFAQSLAEKMMEEHGNGRANYDDEDVDFEMSDDEDEDGIIGDDDDDDDDSEEGGAEMSGLLPGESAFLDGPDEDEEDDSEEDGSEEDDDSDDDMPMMLSAMGKPDSDGDDEEASSEEEEKPKKKKKKRKVESTFADSDEILKNDAFWKKRDSEREAAAMLEAKAELEAEEAAGSGKKKRRKSRKKQ
ncbi:hypothetical protein TrST_g11756 [Triparma strigata]|uniref:CCAAT-binding factor domain-containing protein n=1 Tax=Triparma strigata TaxID=1606541 RepID=A0A9W7B6A2_9STRA|nr:hypothetical protein TrST_g11756 [Triparma strigata]